VKVVDVFGADTGITVEVDVLKQGKVPARSMQVPIETFSAL